jgi:hypothetical protein
MRAGHRGGQRLKGEPTFSIQPADTVWWSTWDYPGNPYYDSRAVRNRAFTVAAVDMIMLDWLHESGKHWVRNARRSDFLGGSMVWLTYVYNALRDDLPDEVQRAYKTGLEKFLDRMHDWGPTGVNDNMDMKANVAMAYIGEAFEDGPLVDKARRYVQRNLKLVHPAGMIRDAGGLEASYNGIALVNIVWAAQVSRWDELVEAVDRMIDLKGHLTFPEPDGWNYFGPSHFNTRTGHGSPTDQWSRPYRDVAAAMLTDKALYLMYGGRRGRKGRWAAPKPETMLKQVKRGIENINDHLEPSDKRFTRWVAGWWAGTINYAHNYYHDGFYEKLVELGDEDAPIIHPPHTRPDNEFIRAFPDPDMEDVPPRERNTFMIARQSDYSAVIYTGPIGDTRYMNFAGGALSAFWTPEGGSIILGRTGLPTRPATTHQDWEHWRIWPTHAISGMTPDGNVFTSARLRRRMSNVEYTVEDDRGRVVISGPIGAEYDGSRTAQNKCITGEVFYKRVFDVTDGAVTIETTLHSDGSDRVAELYEMLPLFLYDARRQEEPHHSVTFLRGREAIEPSSDPVADVTRIEVERCEGGAVIKFDEPQTVRMAPETWKDSYQSRVKLDNVLIDLLDNDGKEAPLETVSVRYHISALQGAPAMSDH